MKFLISIFCLQMLAAAPADEKKLQVEALALAQSEDGTPVPADLSFLPGEVIFFSCQVSGFARMGDDPQKMFLTYEVETLDPKGVRFLPIESGKIANELAPEDRKWRPKIRFTITLPPLADPGYYQVLVRVKDEVGHHTAQEATKFLVGGRAVAPSDSLVVRNFRFLRTEEDSLALPVAAYRPGDTLWARFEMTGYSLAAENRFEIEYGIRVLTPAGKTSFEEPHAASAKNNSFYAQRYTPGIISLNLPKDLERGEYTLVLTLQDLLNHQTYEERHKFSVE